MSESFWFTPTADADVTDPIDGTVIGVIRAGQSYEALRRDGDHLVLGDGAGGEGLVDAAVVAGPTTAAFPASEPTAPTSPEPAAAPVPEPSPEPSSDDQSHDSGRTSRRSIGIAAAVVVAALAVTGGVVYLQREPPPPESFADLKLASDDTAFGYEVRTLRGLPEQGVFSPAGDFGYFVATEDGVVPLSGTTFAAGDPIAGTQNASLVRTDKDHTWFLASQSLFALEHAPPHRRISDRFWSDASRWNHRFENVPFDGTRLWAEADDGLNSVVGIGLDPDIEPVEIDFGDRWSPDQLAAGDGLLWASVSSLDDDDEQISVSWVADDGDVTTRRLELFNRGVIRIEPVDDVAYVLLQADFDAPDDVDDRVVVLDRDLEVAETVAVDDSLRVEDVVVTDDEVVIATLGDLITVDRERHEVIEISDDWAQSLAILDDITMGADSSGLRLHEPGDPDDVQRINLETDYRRVYPIDDLVFLVGTIDGATQVLAPSSLAFRSPQ